jgi:hypothetical protein
LIATVVLAAVFASGAGAAGAGCAKNDADLSAHDAGDESGGFHPDGGVGLDDTDPFELEAGPAYAVLGVSPSHGPFVGGTRIEIRGRGFSSRTKVRLGPIDVAPADVIASDPYHVQVITPPGEVGEVDVQVSDELTGDKSVLPSGFSYDAYYADPNVGATTGGTHVALIGRGTHWSAGTTVTIDGKACTDLAVDDDTHLRCIAPKGTPGTKSITVVTPDSVVSTARDAYTYADTNDGYRGGLAGEKLPGELSVLALSYPDGDLVDSATVIVRGADGTTQNKLTSGSGVAAFPTPPPAPLTVTITKKCLQPTTFAGVEVRSVTAYLSPVMSVACIPPDGTPPPTGGRSRDAGVVKGELVWGNTIEFKRSPWKGIPDLKKPTQRVVAYVFSASNENLARFQLPDPSSAITPDSPGTVGYEFETVVLPGNVTVYAIAGIEDRPEAGPPTFDPYVYGIVRGIGVPTGKIIDRVFIQMTGAFSHSVTLNVPTGPGGAPISPRGPDRLHTTLNVDLGNGYMLLPYGYREDLLPLGGDLQFIGVPSLSGALGSASYAIAVEDVSGGAGGAPLSSVLRYKSRTSGAPITPGPFIPISKLASPAAAEAWNGHTVQLDLPPGVADLIIIGAGSGDGSTAWTIVAPGDARTIELPDFSTKPELGLPGGGLDIGVIAAKLPSPFLYDALRYGQLTRGQWTAYSYDTFTGFW